MTKETKAWEEELNLGGEIIDWEGDLRRNGIEKLEVLISSLISQTKEETRREIAEQIKKLKRGLGVGEGYLIDQSYNDAIDDVVEVIPKLNNN